jgi:hypothetical protein
MEISEPDRRCDICGEPTFFIEKYCADCLDDLDDIECWDE